jgi:amino acid permease
VGAETGKSGRQITVWEAACIITGYGIGGGVLAMPYLANKNGIVTAFVILLAAFFMSLLLHLMIADLALKCDDGNQIVSVFSRFLFRGRAKKPLTAAFLILMAVVLCTNLAVYISGASSVLTQMLPIPPVAAELIFYILAASVVALGLKAVAVSEKIMVTVIFAIIAVLAVFSLTAKLHPLPLAAGSVKDALAYYGVAMFSFSAFFSIPQAVEGLGKDESSIKKAVFLGLGNNLVLIIVITLCALAASNKVTQVGMIGWSAGIGSWASYAGGIFTLLAMLTTYWSISLALSDIIGEQLKLNSTVCWLLATAPSLVLALLNSGGFLDFIEIAGGAIAIIVAVMVVPTYRRAQKEIPGSVLGRASTLPFQILVVIAYVLMAVGNLISV